MPNLLAVLDSLNAGNQAPTEEDNTPIPEDKLFRVYELWVKKVPVNQIAQSFKVAESTIYRWIDKYKQNFDHSLVNKPRSDLLLDMIRFVGVVRDCAMSEVHQIDVTRVKVMPDGSVARNPDHDVKSKGTFLKLALDAQSKAFEMLQKTGVLPTAVKEIHYSLQDTRPVEKVSNTGPTRTKKEIIDHIQELVSNGRVMPHLEEMGELIVMQE